LLISRVILSWIAPYGSTNRIIRYIYEMTEPVLALCRRIFPIGNKIGLDFSPVIAIILLEILEMLVIKLILLI